MSWEKEEEGEGVDRRGVSGAMAGDWVIDGVEEVEVVIRGRRDERLRWPPSWLGASRLHSRLHVTSGFV